MKLPKPIKITLYILAGIITLILLLTLAIYILYKINSTANALADFIKENPEKAALYYVVNDSVKVDLNSNSMMPLASTLKWMVLVEYCKQIEEKVISPNTQISLNELYKYYLPHSDGEAHPNWLKEMGENKKIKENTVTLR